MDTDKKNNDKQREPSNLPATEIVKNPNPRANENIRERTGTEETNEPASGVGSEVTDGEDA